MDDAIHPFGATVSAQGFGRPVPLPPDTALPGSAFRVDAERPLTPQGRERFAQAVLGLQRLEVRLDRLYHSPWLRAVETAALLRPILEGEVVFTDAEGDVAPDRRSDRVQGSEQGLR